MYSQTHAACYKVYKNMDSIIFSSHNTPVDLSKQLHETLPKRFGSDTTMVILEGNGYCPEFEIDEKSPKLDSRSEQVQKTNGSEHNAKTKLEVNKNTTEASINTLTQKKLPTPEQKNICKKIGKYGETAVDLYISGINKTDALQIIENGNNNGKIKEILKEITLSTYNNLRKMGVIQKSTYQTTKETMNLQGEIICLESFN